MKNVRELGQTMRGQFGFTLMELMIVLTISSLLMMIVAPRFAAVLPGMEFKRNSVQFASTLRLARSQAIATQTRVQVVIDASQRVYRIVGTNISGHFSPSTGFFEEGREIGASNDPVRYFSFFANGTASDTALELRQSSKSYLVRVEWLSGGVTIDAST